MTLKCNINKYLFICSQWYLLLIYYRDINFTEWIWRWTATNLASECQVQTQTHSHDPQAFDLFILPLYSVCEAIESHGLSIFNLYILGLCGLILRTVATTSQNPLPLLADFRPSLFFKRNSQFFAFLTYCYYEANLPKVQLVWRMCDKGVTSAAGRLDSTDGSRVLAAKCREATVIEELEEKNSVRVFSLLFWTVQI